LQCWGGNSKGQLGYGDTLSRGNTLNSMGDTIEFVSLGPHTVTSIAAGAYHTCAVLDNGNLK
ncbi:unnamed protein product, partial [Sphacelaria rigidula]